MRILIGNHIDDSIRLKSDMASAVQRILWFAADGDLVVLPAPPDEDFLHYVTALTGVDAATLRIHVPPPGRFEHRLLDPRTLTDPGFVRAVAADLDEVSEVFALWPSPQVARLASELGLSHRLPGAAFTRQGGGELANSKAHFRALAAGAGVATAPGAVCHTAEEAAQAMTGLLARTGAVVVKQAHNGSGNGNEIVFAGDAPASGHVGARHLRRLGPGAVERYWSERWAWASAEGRFPVVVECLVPDAESLFTEYLVSDDAVLPTECGVLSYVGRRLDHQSVPLRHLGVDPAVLESLVTQGARLAQVYRAIGYRGFMSADAVADQAGVVRFTEMNAHVSGSVHIYDVIANRIVGVSAQPRRTVAEYAAPACWGTGGMRGFLATAQAIGCHYDPARRIGAILSAPIPAPRDGGPGEPAGLTQPAELAELAEIMVCLAYDTEETRDKLYERLDREFAAQSADPSCRPPY